MSILDDVRGLITDWMITNEYSVTPKDTVFLMIVSIVVSSLSGGISRLLLDMEDMAKKNDTVQAHNKKKKKAQETADKKLWIAVQKREKMVMDLQRSMMMKRMLPSVITMLPIIFVFSTLRAAFQKPVNQALNATAEECIKAASDQVGSCGVVAVLPFHVPEWLPIGRWFSTYALDHAIDVAGFGFWYFLTAITTSTLIQKIAGVNLTGMQQPGMSR